MKVDVASLKKITPQQLDMVASFVGAGITGYLMYIFTEAYITEMVERKVNQKPKDEDPLWKRQMENVDDVLANINPVYDIARGSAPDLPTATERQAEAIIEKLTGKSIDIPWFERKGGN